MKSVNRMRQQIVDLNTGKIYINESMAEKQSGISRYYIHKSLIERIPIGENMFAYYSYGMNVDQLKEIYMQKYSTKTTRSKKWKKLMELVANQ
jgi:hypothetical protein